MFNPQFIEKVHDVCGLYLNPPERAVVLCVDEKSQIQALDRTAPTLPMGARRCLRGPASPAMTRASYAWNTPADPSLSVRTTRDVTGVGDRSGKPRRSSGH